MMGLLLGVVALMFLNQLRYPSFFMVLNYELCNKIVVVIRGFVASLLHCFVASLFLCPYTRASITEVKQLYDYRYLYTITERNRVDQDETVSNINLPKEECMCRVISPQINQPHRYISHTARHTSLSHIAKACQR